MINWTKNHWQNILMCLVISIICGIVGGCIAIILYFILHGLKIQLSTLAELLSAIGTLSAVIVSLWLAREKKSKLKFVPVQQLNPTIKTKINISNLSSTGTTLRVIEYEVNDSRLDNVKAESCLDFKLASQSCFDFSQFSMDKNTTCFMPGRSMRTVIFDWTILRETLKDNEPVWQELKRNPQQPLTAVITFVDIDGKQYTREFDEHSKMIVV